MIDHVSIGVRDLDRAVRFYETVLATLGYIKLVQRPETAGFGKKYPDFWLNRRSTLNVPRQDDGLHVCLRARSMEEVRAFHDAALAAGGSSDGAPGLRPEYAPNYYAAFIRDPEGNRVEALNFVESAS